MAVWVGRFLGFAFLIRLKLLDCFPVGTLAKISSLKMGIINEGVSKKTT